MWSRVEGGGPWQSPKIFISLNEAVDIASLHRDSILCRRAGTTTWYKWTAIYTTQDTTMTVEPTVGYAGDWGTVPSGSSAAFEMQITAKDLVGNSATILVAGFNVKRP
jgi:hypothetical protein